MKIQLKWLPLVFIAGGLTGAFLSRTIAVPDPFKRSEKFSYHALQITKSRPRDNAKTTRNPEVRFREEIPLERAEMESLVRKLGSGSMSAGITVTASAVENLNLENIDGAIQALKEARDAGKDFGISEKAIWERIGEMDGANQLAKRMPEHPDDSPEWGVKTCVAGWAIGDPEAAKTWFSSLPDGKWKTSVFENLVTGLSRKDPLNTAEYLGTLPAEVQLNAAANIAYHLVQAGGASAADTWIRTLESTAGKTAAQKAFDSVYGRMILDHSYAAEWLAGENAAPYFDVSRQARFASSWAQKEPDEAADWAVTRSSPDCLKRVISSCPEDKFTTLATWLGHQEGSGVYKQAVKAFADRIQSTDPESAEKWRKQGGE